MTVQIISAAALIGALAMILALRRVRRRRIDNHVMRMMRAKTGE
jgi:hypothetical protein